MKKTLIDHARREVTDFEQMFQKLEHKVLLSGLSSSTLYNKWITTRSQGKYLYPKKALRQVFKGKFMAALKGLAASNTIVLSDEVRERCYRKKWVVYAKRPFADPRMSSSTSDDTPTKPPSLTTA